MDDDTRLSRKEAAHGLTEIGYRITAPTLWPRWRVWPWAALHSFWQSGRSTVRRSQAWAEARERPGRTGRGPFWGSGRLWVKPSG
jgi:hypothetical protein